MAWLVSEDRVLATAEIATGWRERMRGLIARDHFDGVLVLQPARSVHTFGVRFPIDVAFCTADLEVIDTVTMVANRLGRPRIRAAIVIEAPKGSFERWGLKCGDELELRA